MVTTNPGNGNGGNGRGNGRGPPSHANAAERGNERANKHSGGIHISESRLKQLESQIDWDNLSPIEEYLLILASEA